MFRLMEKQIRASCNWLSVPGCMEIGEVPYKSPQFTPINAHDKHTCMHNNHFPPSDEETKEKKSDLKVFESHKILCDIERYICLQRCLLQPPLHFIS